MEQLKNLKNLKNLRKNSGLTQGEVAEKIGVDRTTYVKYENGDSEPNRAILMSLANLFHVSIDYLFDLTDDICLAGSPLATFIRKRRGNESEKSFADRCGIKVDLLRRIEEGFCKKDTGNRSDQIDSMSTEDMRRIAKALKVNPIYIFCLYDGINPHRVVNLDPPDDDLTAPAPKNKLPVRLEPLNLSLFEDDNSSIVKNERALLDIYRSLNEEGQEKLLSYADDLMDTGKYKKRNSHELGAANG